MKPDRDTLLDLVAESLREEVALPAETNVAEVRLVGPQAVLKSVGLVALLIGVEDRLRHRHGLLVSLMDEHALSQSRSPFRTVGTLADYLFELLQAS